MNEILAYYQAICDGSVVVGKWIRKWYAYIVNGLEKGLFFFNAKKANSAISFIENFCRHSQGSLGGQLIKLELWQKAMISVLFGIVDKTGARQFRECFCCLGRKQGKTLLAGAISAYCAVCDGEYGGRIYFVAPKLEQAGLCYDAFQQIIETDPELKKLKLKRRSDVYFPDSNTLAKPLAYSASRSDGLNISLVICDECSAWRGEAGLRFFEVLRSSFGARRQPLLLAISTAGYENDGVYDELMKRATAVLNGSSHETRFAPFLYIIDDVSKCFDINELRKSLPNLGVSVSVDYMLEEIAIAESSLPKRAEYLTKYCNVKSNASVAWFEYQDIEKCMGEEITLESLRSSYCVAGVDLSQAVDLTSATIVVEKNGILHVVNHMWMPENRLEKGTEEDGVPYRIMIEKGFLSLSGESYVDYHDVVNWFVRLVDEFEVLPLAVGYDRYSAQYFVAELKQRLFKCFDVKQGTNLTPVIREVDGYVKDGRFRFGNNSLFQSHLLNSALKTDEEGAKVRLVKVGKNTRIDGMASLLDAMCVRQAQYSEIGERLKNKE